MEGLPLAELVTRCAEESHRFTRGQAHDDRFCYEIFRRAIVERDGAAWEAVIAQYRSLVRDWIWRHALAARIEDHDDLTMRVFERFWQAVQPERFAAFPHLAGVLRYLKLCVFAAVVDEARAQQSWQSHRAAGELADEVEGARVDEVVLDELGRADFWRTIEAVLTDPAERLVIRLSYVTGLKPAAIASQQPALFPAVEDVYRRKRLALERLRRDARTRQFWRE